MEQLPSLRAEDAKLGAEDGIVQSLQSTREYEGGEYSCIPLNTVRIRLSTCPLERWLGDKSTSSASRGGVLEREADVEPDHLLVDRAEARHGRDADLGSV